VAARQGGKKILTTGVTEDMGEILAFLPARTPALQFGLTLLDADTYNPNSLTDCVLEFIA
jgi:hypothetical protein